MTLYTESVADQTDNFVDRFADTCRVPRRRVFKEKKIVGILTFIRRIILGTVELSVNIVFYGVTY